MIKIVSGNILESKEKYICHQCNCKTVRAANMALSMFTAFPYSDIYKERSQIEDKGLLSSPGNIIIRGNGNTERYIINMLAQVYPGKPKFNDGIDCGIARESYFKDCLNKILLIEKLDSIAFPYKIGCGMAGGNWDNYVSILEEFSSKIDAKVFVYQLGELV